MLTLIDSVGNEFSHEIGHHYGLGHYPGSVNNNMFWAAHHADSGWGYIAFRNKMRGNLNWTSTNLGDGSNGVPNFLNKYAYVGMRCLAVRLRVRFRNIHITQAIARISRFNLPLIVMCGIKTHQLVIKSGMLQHELWKLHSPKYRTLEMFGTTQLMGIT